MNLGFDLDGVLYPWHEKVWKELTNMDKIDTTFDGYWSNYKEWRTEGNNETLFMNLVNDPLMYSSQAPYFGVRSFLKSLEIEGHDIWYITQRPRHVDFTTRAWVKHWRLAYPENVIRVETSKRLPVIEKEIDLFVDDAIRHAEDLKDYTKVILRNRPWNVGAQENFDTVDSVLQVGRYINGK
jgi:FMN phosphatase YigB (HAD superfamily)